MAVSAHEAAHALQDADDYAPLEILYVDPPPHASRGTTRDFVGDCRIEFFFGSQPMFLWERLPVIGSIAFHFVTLPSSPTCSRWGVGPV